MIYRLTNATGSAGAVNITFREDDVITGLMLDAVGVSTNGDTRDVEVSFNANDQFAVNDAAGVIASGMTISPDSSTGTGGQAIRQSITFPNPIPVSGGERLYLHVAAGVLSQCTVYTKAGSAKPTATRR